MRNLLESAIAWGLELSAAAVSKLPRQARYHVAAALGFIFGVLARDMRKGLQSNLHVLFEMEKIEFGPSANTIFKNFARTLCDFFLPDNITVHVPQRQKLEELRKSHPGMLLLTFHMGHWELGARTMRQWGWPVTAVYQPYRNKKFKSVIESRRAPGVNFIAVGQNAANGVREALRRGDVVAMLGDLPFGEEGTKVKLLGHKMMWPKGPVVLAVREKCPIVVAIVVRTGIGEYTAVIEDPLIPQGRGKTEVDRLVQEVADKFGKFLPQYSSQWYRFRPFEFVS